MSGPIFALIGLGLGVAILAGTSLAPRKPAPAFRPSTSTTYERALEAQRISADASELARELTEKWNHERRSQQSGG